MSHSPQRDRPPGETGGSPSRPSRRLVGPALHFDLPTELATLKEEPSWRDGDRNARTLVEHPVHRVVLTALKAGTHVREHRAPGWVSIHVVAGHLRLRLPDDETIDLLTGGFLVLQPSFPHDVEAVEESAFLLSVTAAEPAGHAD